mgnify:CR=1 FL=1
MKPIIFIVIKLLLIIILILLVDKHAIWSVQNIFELGKTDRSDLSGCGQYTRFPAGCERPAGPLRMRSVHPVPLRMRSVHPVPRRLRNGRPDPSGCGQYTRFPAGCGPAGRTPPDAVNAIGSSPVAVRPAGLLAF